MHGNYPSKKQYYQEQDSKPTRDSKRGDVDSMLLSESNT